MNGLTFTILAMLLLALVAAGTYLGNWLYWDVIPNPKDAKKPEEPKEDAKAIYLDIDGKFYTNRVFSAEKK